MKTLYMDIHLGLSCPSFFSFEAPFFPRSVPVNNSISQIWCGLQGRCLKLAKRKIICYDEKLIRTTFIEQYLFYRLKPVCPWILTRNWLGFSFFNFAGYGSSAIPKKPALIPFPTCSFLFYYIWGRLQRRQLPRTGCSLRCSYQHPVESILHNPIQSFALLWLRHERRAYWSLIAWVYVFFPSFTSTL